MPVLDTGKDLSALFIRQAQATPDAVALEDSQSTYTYAELDKRSADLADRLRHHGVQRDGLVGVLLPRSADYVIACLAALRSGGAFLVLELAYPPELLADVLEDANPAVVVTYTAETGKIKDGVNLIKLDEGADESNGYTDGYRDQPNESDLDKLAFVAYSSGTTGKPKGIANPHKAAVLSYDLRFGLSDTGPGDRVACNVFFVWEILRPLLRGGTVFAVSDETSYDPLALVDLLASQKITETLVTPTLLAAVLSRHPRIGTRLPELKTLWLNGEVVTTDLAKRAMKALPNVRLLNVYSACETHEIACGDIGNMLDPEATYCPVGPLLDPKHAYVLDESGKKVGVGTSGELYVGGEMLARGYINRPETTAQAFIMDEFNVGEGKRMYRTGDLARLLPSGDLEITGRVGSMIKLRGYSVVPGKVESAIVSHLAVKQCTIVGHGEGLDKQLVAYIVKDEESSEDRPAVEVDESGYAPGARRALSEHLAQYMIPALWVDLTEIPTHEVSGKVDMDRLPAPPSPKAMTNGKKEYVDPIGIKDVAAVSSPGEFVARGSFANRVTDMVANFARTAEHTHTRSQLLRPWRSFIVAC